MIHFDENRLQKVKHTHDLWWEGKLDRPLMKLAITDAHPLRETRAPLLSQANCTDFSYSPDEIVDATDAHLGRFEFLGDSFPSMDFTCFGPGVLAAFCGAEIRNETGGVWFFPKEELPIDKIRIEYDPENIYVQRIKALYRAGIDRWGNGVLLGMPDLGGVLDVVATFVGSESLLIDLYDAPEEVERLVAETEAAWYAAYDDFSTVLQAANMGHTDWDGIYSSKPSYVLQCDFCYMIGPEMFDRFVLPTIKRDCGRLHNTIFHLDGIGELPHLDSLLSIGDLNAVQWQYGTGSGPVKRWVDVYEKIINAGKLLQIIDNENEFNTARELIKRYGHRVYFSAYAPSSLRDEMDKLLAIR